MGKSLISPEKVQSREYQQTIARNVIQKGNSLVILPTGLGKTVIALLVMEEHLKKDRKVLFLAPTRPLVDQHYKTITSLMTLPNNEVLVLNGGIPAKKRAKLWKDARVVVSTPQTISNDLKAKRIWLDDFGLAVIDECHRTIGNYAYTFVGENCVEKGVQVLGLTASPGGKREKINALRKTLGITHIEIRVESDEDVKPYVKGMDVSWVEVELPKSLDTARQLLEEVISEKLSTLKKFRLVNSTKARLPKQVLVGMYAKIQKHRWSNKFMKGTALSYYATVMKLAHAHELFETQGVGSFLEYMDKIEKDKDSSKAIKRIFSDGRVQRVIDIARSDTGEHPKLSKLVGLLCERRGKKAMVFVQYRSQVKRIEEELLKNGLRAKQFVGKRDGVTGKQQKETMQEFRDSAFDILVASSIGEEGLDVPSVDTVIFYEPVPSEIRTIQRRGRAGRAKTGEVIVLITKGTRDEVYYWVSKKREKNMKKIVKGMQASEETGKKGFKRASEKNFEVKKAGQRSINDFF